MSYVSAVVVAAGRGERLRSKIPKPLVKINSYPVIIHCLKTLSQHRSIDEIILVVNAQVKDKVIRKIRQYRIPKIKEIVNGGRRRQDSVRRGVRAINSRADLVLIHDGARPFIRQKTISSVIKEAKRSGAAIVGVPVKATVKSVVRRSSFVVRKFIVKETLDRSNLWEIQTPQVFSKDLILKAYRRFGNTDVTDDAMLVEKLGAKVSVVLGSYDNIKITTPEDLILAEAILKE